MLKIPLTRLNGGGKTILVTSVALGCEIPKLHQITSRYPTRLEPILKIQYGQSKFRKEGAYASTRGYARARWVPPSSPSSSRQPAVRGPKNPAGRKPLLEVNEPQQDSEMILSSPPLRDPPSFGGQPEIDPYEAATRLRRKLLAIWVLVWLALSSDFFLAYMKVTMEVGKEAKDLPEYERRALVKQRFEKLKRELEEDRRNDRIIVTNGDDYGYSHHNSVHLPYATHDEDEKEKEPIIRHTIHHYSVTPTLAQWVVDNFAYSPSNIFPNPGHNDWRPWTLFTHQFAHMHVFHLAGCYMAAGVFFPELIALYGTRTVMKLFLAGGAIAAGLHNLYERITNPAGRMTLGEIRGKLTNPRTPIEEKQTLARYFQRCIGSSTSLVTLGTIGCFITPHVRAAFLFIPIAIPIRALMAIQFTFDSIGLLYDYGFGISHAGHIASNVAGILMFYLFVRKIPSKAWMGMSYAQMRHFKAQRLRSKINMMKNQTRGG